MGNPAYKPPMREEQPPGSSERRHRRRRRSFWKRLPDKLVSRRFNLYQLVMVLIAAYAAYRVIIYFVDRPAAIPAE